MKCRKCGAELHPDQKVCIACGERTAAGGNFFVEEEKAWRPSRNQIAIAGAIVFVVIMVLIANALRPVPPEVVAEKWFSAMSQRQIGKAEGYVTEQFKLNVTPGMTDLNALSDNYYDILDTHEATATYGKPMYRTPNTVVILVTMKAKDGSVVGTGQMELVKVGRRWMINKAS